MVGGAALDGPLEDPAGLFRGRRMFDATAGQATGGRGSLGAQHKAICGSAQRVDGEVSDLARSSLTGYRRIDIVRRRSWFIS